MNKLITVILVLINLSFAGIKAPDFSLKDENGKTINLQSLKGNVVVLNFWGINCHSCKEEFPELEKVHQKYKNQNVKFFAIVIDTKDKNIILDRKKNWGFSIPVLFADEYVMEKYRIIGTPITYILDKNLEVIKIFYGKQNFETFDKYINKALGR